MGKLLKFTLGAIWIMDILNMPFMEPLDTTMPLNGLFWFLIWILCAILED